MKSSFRKSKYLSMYFFIQCCSSATPILGGKWPDSNLFFNHAILSMSKWDEQVGWPALVGVDCLHDELW